MTEPTQQVSRSVILKAMNYDCSKCGARRSELCREGGVEVAGVHSERIEARIAKRSTSF